MDLEPYMKTVQVVDLDKVKNEVQTAFPSARCSDDGNVVAILDGCGRAAALLGTGWTETEAWLTALERVQKLDKEAASK